MGQLPEDCKRIFKEFVENAKKHLIECVLSNKERFPDNDKIINHYHDAVAGVCAHGDQRLRAFHEVHNELCTATAILEGTNEPKVTYLQYEPTITNCNKRFDFHVTMSDGTVKYIEVKTIHPTTQDDWEKYQCALKKQRFPKDTHLILDNEWLGGELYHNAYASRTKMMDYALDLEKKIEACLSDIFEKMVFLVLFTNGFHWHLDELEDFVFFYFNGFHFPGDHFSSMEKFVVKEKNIVFNKTIDCFSFIKRPKTELKPNRVIWNVIPPKIL